MKNICHLWIGILLLFLGCSTTTKPEGHIYSADSTLITPYTFSLEDKSPMKPPYVAVYSSGVKKLFYVAATHIAYSKSKNLLKHPTLMTIQKIFKDHPIDAVVVEGVGYWGKEIPANTYKHADECEATKYKVNCGEAWFTIQQARKKQALLLSGEPSEQDTLNVVRERGFDTQDLLAFYVVRQVPAWISAKAFKKKPLRKLLEEQIAFKKKIMGVEIPFTVEDFESWYQKHMHKPFKVEDITVNDSAPVSSQGASYTQKISSAVGVARNRSAVEKIALAMNKSSHILVVYGASHLLMQKKALEKMLGQATYKKLF